MKQSRRLRRMKKRDVSRWYRVRVQLFRSYVLSMLQDGIHEDVVIDTVAGIVSDWRFVNSHR